MTLHKLSSISDFYRLRGLPPPQHPLIGVIRLGGIKQLPEDKEESLLLDFYMISLKRNHPGKLKYGRQPVDFDDGVMGFLPPGSMITIAYGQERQAAPSGWTLLVHPDLLWNTPLARTIKQFGYFQYLATEALFLSEKEEAMVNGIIDHIEQEYRANIDGYSQDIIVAHLELLLRYADRFYHRQFITRKIPGHRLLQQMVEILDSYFSSDELLRHGLPTVAYVADRLHVSPNYLSAMLKVHTGQSTQEHIHNRLITKAKEKLATTALSISEIAYELGFEHSQSFSRLFKTKTSLSPGEFRQRVN